MGQVITQFIHEHRVLPQTSFFTDKSLSKIQQYYLVYKNNSDTFAIDDTVFKDIFGGLHPVFNILDTHASLLIDGLQLFSAMALFSKLVKLEDKIQFIFKIFDFNELRSLSITDLEFMILTCTSVTHKLLNIKSPLADDYVINFVHQQFESHSRVNISEVKKWGMASSIVSKFIYLINNEEQLVYKNQQHKQPKPTRTLLSQKIYRSYQVCSRNQLGSLFSSSARLAAVKKKTDKQTERWLIENRKLIDCQVSLHKQALTSTKTSDPCDLTVIPKWIYGIRFKDVKYFMEFINQNQLVYYVGKIVILLNLKSQKQRYYLQHDKSVICLATCRLPNNQYIVATSEMIEADRMKQELPSIRIWNPATLKTVAVINGQHKIGVHLMKFTNSGRYLITCGLLFYSPIIIYNTYQKFQPFYSIACSHPTVQISTIFGVVDKKLDDFVVATLYGIKYFQFFNNQHSSQKKQKDQVSCYQIRHSYGEDDLTSYKNYKYRNFSAITCSCFIHANYYEKYLSEYDDCQQKLILTGHEQGEVLVWSATQKTIIFQLCIEMNEITSIVPSVSNILICSNSSILSFWDIDLKRKKKQYQIDITTFDISLKGYQICGIVQKPLCENAPLSLNYEDYEYLICTMKGDFFSFGLKHKQDSSLKYKLIGPRYQANRIQSIISIGPIWANKLLERQNEDNLLLYGGPSGNLYIINAVSHALIQIWKIGQPIISVDCIQTKQCIQIVAATQNNRVYFSSNFSEKNQKYQSQKPIKCIKLIIDNGHVVMVLGLEGGYLHFINSEQNYQKKKSIRSVSPSQQMTRKLFSKTDEGHQMKILTSNHNFPNANSLNYQQNSQNKEMSNMIKKIKLGSSPTQIISLEKKMLLVCTEDNIFYLVYLKDYHFKVIQPQKSPLSSQLIRHKSLKCFYCLSQNAKGGNKIVKKLFKLPAVMGKNEKLFIIANLNGSISIWKKLTQSIEENKLQFNWHSSRCSHFAISHDETKFFSAGFKDGMIVQSYLMKFYQPKRSITDPSKAITSLNSVISIFNSHQSPQVQSEADILIQKQIDFCTFNNQITTQRYDQHIQVRGLENAFLSRLFKGMSEQWKMMNKLATSKGAPKLSLKLQYAYGIQTQHKRSTIFSINHPCPQFVYFVSNVVIVYDPTMNSQRIYRGHRNKITCIAKILMPEKIRDRNSTKVQIQANQLIASGESAYKAVINIWNPQNLETIKTIHTIHTWGVINIICTEKSILSYGIFSKPLSGQDDKYQQDQRMDKIQNQDKRQRQNLFSLELTQLATGFRLGIRQTKQKFLSMAVHPNKANQFITTGKYNVTLWKAVSGNIERVSVIQTYCTVTACIYQLVEQPMQTTHDEQSLKINDYIQNKLDYVQQIVVGCDDGSLGIVSDYSKFIIVEEKAHQKSINTISYILAAQIQKKSVQNSGGLANNCYLNKNIRHIVTSSEDQTVKIWSKSFQLQFQQQIRKVQFQQKVFLNNNYFSNDMSPNVNNQALANLMGINNNKKNSVSNINQKQKCLIKTMAVQSVCPIANFFNQDTQICLLLATRNGDVIIMKQSQFSVNKKFDNKMQIKKPKIDNMPSFDQRVESDKQSEMNKNQFRRRPSRSNSKNTKFNINNCKSVQKSAIIANKNKNKLRLQKTSISQISSFLRSKNTQFEIQQEREESPVENRRRVFQAMKFILYMRGHSSQFPNRNQSTSQGQKQQKGCRLLFCHHPRLQIIATIAEDQNLIFWDTQRNIIILNTILGLPGSPTVIKFTKDGDILMVGSSGGFLSFLDSQISNSNKGKSNEKFTLPSLRAITQVKCGSPVLSIEQSESGDHIAVSLNNKPVQSCSNQKFSQNKSSQTSHICIFLNRTRDKMRHGNNKMEHLPPFQKVTTIPCQAVQLYRTFNNNQYGMAVHSMMFTQNQGKTYLLIYEQLIDVHRHRRLNCSKNGNYVIWDVNTSTMITNTDQVSNLIWKKISVPNSIFAKYLTHGERTDQQQQMQQVKQQIGRKAKPANNNLNVPHMTEMLNLPNHLILGSINGDIHILQSSCLQYENIMNVKPRGKDLFIGKTYPSHCSQVSHLQFNQQRSFLYSVGIFDKCVFKWKIQGDFNIQIPFSLSNNQQKGEQADASKGHLRKPTSILAQIEEFNNENADHNDQNVRIDDEADLFKQVPSFDMIEQMKQNYLFKHKFSWISILPSKYSNKSHSEFLEKSQNYPINNFIRNLTDFIQTIKVINIIGRKAHNIRCNLWYDKNERIIYSSGHAIIALKNKINSNKKQKLFMKNRSLEQQIRNKDQISSFFSKKTSSQEKQFIHIINGRGEELCQDINALWMSQDRSLILTGHNGLYASISIWDASTKLRLKTLVVKNIMIALMIRTSSDNKSLIVYGINQYKTAFLMMYCIQSCQLLGITNFLQQKAWHIKDIAFYPYSNCKFVTCGVNNTLSWKLQGNQLTYGILQCSSAYAQKHNANSSQNYDNQSSQNFCSTIKSISICVGFLPKSQRIVTGCQDGNLIFWGENSFQSRQHADMIMVLKTCPPNILLTASRDGSILFWMEQNNGNLNLFSRFNIKNQLASFFKPHGMSLYQKNTRLSEQAQEADKNRKQEQKLKKKKIKTKVASSTNKQIQQSLKYQNSKNPLQQQIYQELCIQSIDILSLNDKQQTQKQFKFYSESCSNKTASQQNELNIQKQRANKVKNGEQMVQKQGQKQMSSQQTMVSKKLKVLIGTTSGNIYQSIFSYDQNSKSNVDQGCQLLSVYHDHETPKSFFFSKTDTEIYEITSKGYFSCRRIADSAMIFQQNFNKETVDMIYSPKNDIFYIVFKTQVRSYQTLQKMADIQNYETLLKPLSTLQIKFITHAEISAHQKILALGITKNSDRSVNIEIYDISKTEQIKYLLSFAMPLGETIQFIDFSSNNKIVLAKLQSGKLIAQELINLQIVKQQLITFTEWNNKAQNFYDRNIKMINRVQDLFSSNIIGKNSANAGSMMGQICNENCNNEAQSQQLKIVRIAQISDNIFIIIDNQGNVYGFNNELQLIGQSRLKISSPSIVRFSHSKKLLGIGSCQDRNIVILDVTLTDLLKGYN